MPPDIVPNAYNRMYAKQFRFFLTWKEITQKPKEEAAAEAFFLARSFFLERQARVRATTEQAIARYAEIADNGVTARGAWRTRVAHALERERIRFVLQEMGDSDYSDYDEDGRNKGLAARVAREALFMESREEVESVGVCCLRQMFPGTFA